MKRTLVLFAAISLTAQMAAQGKLQPQTDPAPPPVSMNIDVRIINIDVVVTDRRGNPIAGLTKDDFEIRENNVPKPITNFYEVAGSQAKNVVADSVPNAPVPPAQPAAPQSSEDIPDNMKRRIIFYIDNLSLAPFNRNRVFKDMKEFLKTAMRPGDEAMVATYNRSMKVRVPFTRDPKQIESILDTVAGESGQGIANRSERRDVEDRIREAPSYTDAIATARAYASSVEHDLRQSVASLNALMTTLAGVEGKKILVLTSEGFPMQPGREMFYMVDEISREKGWSNVGSTMIEGMHFDSSNLITQVGKTANANGITLYTVHAAGLSMGTEMSAEHARPVPTAVTHAASQNTIESMMHMANMTGGLASVNTNNFAEAFRKITRDLESYYSLGYRAGTERVDRQRYINVKVKNKDYVVRNRQTFVEKSVYAEMGDRAVANLLYQTKDNDMRILARMGRTLPTDDGYYRVPVDVIIPMESLTLLPQGDEFVGGFDVYVVVANKHNDMSDIARKSHQIRVTAEQMKSLKGKYYTYTLDMLMEKGLNKISIGVVDQVSNTTGFTREQIIAQDMR